VNAVASVTVPPAVVTTTSPVKAGLVVEIISVEETTQPESVSGLVYVGARYTVAVTVGVVVKVTAVEVAVTETVVIGMSVTVAVAAGVGNVTVPRKVSVTLEVVAPLTAIGVVTPIPTLSIPKNSAVETKDLGIVTLRSRPLSDTELPDFTVLGVTMPSRTEGMVTVPPRGLLQVVAKLGMVPVDEAVVAVIAVAESLVTMADLPPIKTEVAFDRLVPVIVTLVPPAVVPEIGVTLVMVGMPAKVYVEVDVAVPEGVVTDTLTLPAASAGVTALIVVADVTV
jgi:hypothetical protein